MGVIYHIKKNVEYSASTRRGVFDFKFARIKMGHLVPHKDQQICGAFGSST